MGFTGCDGPLERLPVHVPKHKNLAGFGAGRDAGDQAILIEAGRQIAAFLDLFDREARLEINALKVVGHNWVVVVASPYDSGVVDVLSHPDTAILSTAPF